MFHLSLRRLALLGAFVPQQPPLHVLVHPGGTPVANEPFAAIGDVDGDGVSELAVGLSGRIDIFDGATGAVRYKRSVYGHPSLGLVVDAAHDFDGDGDLDFCASSLDAVFVFRGRDGAVVLRVPDPQPPGNFGLALAAPGDLDGDGVGELVVGTPHDGSGGHLAGRVDVVSGASGTVLRTHYGAAEERLGQAVEAFADIDGDGVPDYFVSAPFAGPLERGRVELRSGATGALVWSRAGPSYSDYGWSIDRLGDLDGDGLPELIVGAPDANTSQDAGYYEVVTALGDLRFSEQGTKDLLLGLEVEGVADLDGDGFDDFAVGAADDRVRLYSGASGAPIDVLTGAPYFGRQIEGIGDLDGDGRGDFMVWEGDNGPPLASHVFLGTWGGIGARFCTQPDKHGGGQRANLLASGSTATADDRVLLQAQRIPSGTPVLLLASETTDLISNPGGSAGVLCLGSGFLRFTAALRTTGAVGTCDWTLDLADFPGYGPVLPGDSWSFQVWFRDPPTSNFSDAVRVIFL